MAVQKQNPAKYIYIADDDEDDRAFFADALLEIAPDVVVKEAEDGTQLMNILHKVSSGLPDIIFLDINMPGKNGFECVEEIRSKKESLRDVVIVMLSTSNDPLSMEKAQKIGATYYAVKPNCFNALKSFLGDILKMDLNSNIDRKFRLI
ncbi:response regulator [Flavobacterium aquicola]|uniref:Response regulator receiver domain-containing protein n=1 Tax=Flavobacterium aquicola TaxID=1682742 RepID=A0A3E0E3X0_9FLAO|nr:response regulator [Flavobacterium aquicola]REG91636.1 response regulator receiver domain-containing protein [Flavobacterium aquicola]